MANRSHTALREERVPVNKCEWCGVTDATVKQRVVICGDVCRCEMAAIVCVECAAHSHEEPGTDQL